MIRSFSKAKMASVKKIPERWTKKEHDFAINNYGPMTAEEVGKKINKSAHAVRKYIQRYDDRRLGIK